MTRGPHCADGRVHVEATTRDARKGPQHKCSRDDAAGPRPRERGAGETDVVQLLVAQNLPWLAWPNSRAKKTATSRRPARGPNFAPVEALSPCAQMWNAAGAATCVGMMQRAHYPAMACRDEFSFAVSRPLGARPPMRERRDLAASERMSLGRLAAYARKDGHECRLVPHGDVLGTRICAHGRRVANLPERKRRSACTIGWLRAKRAPRGPESTG